MELDKALVTKIDTFIDAWLINDTPGEDMEMEAVFGDEGVVDAATFMAVAQRLQGRGFTAKPQDDRLSILVQSGLRFSIEGLGVLPILQNYCRDDKIQGKPFSVLNKSRHSAESKVDIEDYGFYLKNRIEERVAVTDPRVTELLDVWPQLDKAFRLIKRWTFEGQGMRIDMSIVRSTPSIVRAGKKEYLWQKTFQERDIFKQPVRYEIEVELQRGEHTTDRAGARRCLVRGIGEILKAMQKNTFLITIPEAERVKRDYTALNKFASFRGVQPITMEVKHMAKHEEGSIDDKLPNVRKNYNVTDKADGLRVLIYCDGKGEMFLIDGGMMVYKTGLLNKSCHDCLLDAEWVHRDKEHRVIAHVLIFDIYYLKGLNVSEKDFYDTESKETRYEKMNEWFALWSGNADGGIKTTVHGVTPANQFQIKIKHFEFADPERPNTIFARCATILNTEQPYETDGLILSPNKGSLPQKSGDTFWEQFKWKPANANTIDFLVKFEKARGSSIDRVEIGDPDMGGENGYKTARLFVGSIKDPAYDDPRATILNESKLPESQYQKRHKSQSRQREKLPYQPSYFIPEEYPDPMANTCNLPVHTNEESGDQYVETVDSKEPIMENMIVEMRYDPSRNAGWRWIPMRIRHDKTERFAKGIITRTLNSEINANGVWNSIHNPITLSMITTGSTTPTVDELAAYSRRRRYYNREASKEDLSVIRGLRDFHNLWIKAKLLYKPTLSPGGKTLLDLSCGPGGDLRFWIENKADFVLGVDVDESNIRDNKQGIYRRYMNNLIDKGRDKVPPMVFVQADSSLPLLKGEAANSSLEKDRDEDKNILRALFARERADAVVPRLVSDKLMSKLKDGAQVASCMFSLHYFLKDMETFNGFLNNLKECVAIGGYFIGCCTDGAQVFELLKAKEKGDAAVGKEGDMLVWSITKGYDADAFRPNEESVGLPIDVRFISIGAEHTEYLVNFEYLTRRLAEIGFEPSQPSGLKHASNLFEASYAAIPNNEKEYPMSAVVKQYSFLNRWFVFKRKGEVENIIVEEVITEDKEGKEEEEEEEVVEVVAPVKSAPITNLPDAAAVFQPSEIFPFGPKVGLRDTFGLGEDRSPKILAPYWPFPIQDEEDGTEYPSLEHYWAAMKLKHAAGKPDLGVTLFSTKSGAIHLHAKAEIAKLKIKPNPNSKTDKAKVTSAILDEFVTIKNIMSPKTLLKDHAAVVDPKLWNDVKDHYYRRGLQHRYDKDAVFRRIVDEAKKKKVYLLYSLPKDLGDPIGELAGVWKDNGRVEGGNKIGKTIMEVANFLF